jgi:hypothetical protein
MGDEYNVEQLVGVEHFGTRDSSGRRVAAGGFGGGGRGCSAGQLVDAGGLGRDEGGGERRLMAAGIGGSSICGNGGIGDGEVVLEWRRPEWFTSYLVSC